MEKGPKTARPVGRTRRVAGLVLVALGVLVAARMVWMGVFYSPWFGHDEWVRFAGLLWLGTVMALVGCWLGYRSRLAAWAVAVALVALFVMAYVHDHWLR